MLFLKNSFFLPKILSKIFGLKRVVNIFSLLRVQYFDDNYEIIHYFDTFHFASRNKQFTSKIYATLHDISSIILPETYPFRSKIYKIQSLIRCKKNNVNIISISEKTAVDLYRIFNIGSSFVIHNPVKFKISQSSSFINEKNTFLVVGAYHKRKNYEKLISYWKPHYPKLNIVGKSLRELKNISIPKNVFLHENISDDDLYDFYKSSYGLINTSLDEGFCLPVFEMLNLGGLVFDFGNLQIINEFEVNNYYKCDYESDIDLNIKPLDVKVQSKFPSSQYNLVYKINTI